MFTFAWARHLPQHVTGSGLLSGLGAVLAGLTGLSAAVALSLFGGAALPDGRLVLLAALVVTAGFGFWNLSRRGARGPVWLGVGLAGLASLVAGPALG
jgi:hypothetical protein